MGVSGQITLRRWRDSDVDGLQRYINNRKIWLNLIDRVPHPYTRGDAENWIALSQAENEPALQFAIDLGGEAIGGTGLTRFDDVHRMTVELGYWIAEPFWGRGFATIAAGLATAYAFETLQVERIQAGVFAWNPASARVLEKNLYTLEGRMRRSVIKDGQVIDSMLYARVR